MDSVQLILLLMEIPGIGGKTIEAILRKNAVLRRSPDDVLSLSEARLMEEYGLRKESAAHLASLSLPTIKQAEADGAWLRQRGVELVTPLQASYPARLADRMAEPPSVLFSYGNGGLLNGKLMAVANSNKASEEALAAGDRAAELAVEAGWAVVTGHNRIPYQRPALAARRNGGRICYVLDRGLIHGFGGDLTRELFPAARIWGPAYDPASDLTLTPFGLRDHGFAVNNRRRDSLIFAMADVIFAGEVRKGGQMEAECLGTLRGGRPVYLVGPVKNAALVEAGAIELAPGGIAGVLAGG